MPASAVIAGAQPVPHVRLEDAEAGADVAGPAQRSWLSLLVTTRLLGAGAALALLAVHHVTGRDPALIAVTIVWTAASLALSDRWRPWRERPSLWALDGAAALGLVWLSGDWRSPFYVYALTALVWPSTSLAFREALLWACAFTAAYFAVAVATELDAGTLRSSIRVETVATHLMVPIVVALALAYAADLLRRLRAEREQTERLAIQAERQRIAWELHDSAKQRVHAAHLVLSAAEGAATDAVREGIDHALGELRAAAADMDTSVAELRAPLESRPVGELLRARAGELEAASTAEIHVDGDLPPMPPLVAVHAYRIASEALTNAVRHARATRIDVCMAAAPDGATVVIADDGVGLPVQPRPGSHGLRAMRSRAESIDASLRIGTRPDGSGTEVLLRIAGPGEAGSAR